MHLPLTHSTGRLGEDITVRDRYSCPSQDLRDLTEGIPSLHTIIMAVVGGLAKMGFRERIKC